MNFFKTTILSGINSITSLVMGVITNKLIAALLGAEGMAVTGQFKDLMKLSLSLGGLGMNTGLIKYTAEFKDRKKNLRKILSSAIRVQLLISAVLGIIIFIFRNQIQQYLIEEDTYSEVFLLIGTSIIPMVLFNFIMSVYNGFREIRRYVKINLINIVTGAISTITFLFWMGLKGVIISLFLNNFFFLIIALLFLKKSSFGFSLLRNQIEKESIKKLLKFSVMSIAGTISLAITLILIRRYLTVALGLNYAGYWEAMWRVSSIYLTLLTSSFGLYLLPTFSSLKTKYLKAEVFKIWKFTIPLAILISLSIYLLRDIAIEALYSEEFLVISSLFLFQLAGDTLKINSWVLGNLVIAKAQVNTFVAIQIGWAVIFYALCRLLVPIYGLQGVSIAYFSTYVLHFSFMNLYFRKLLWKINRSSKPK